MRQFLKGYLRLKLFGFSPERFITLCGKQGIALWNIVRNGDSFFLNILLTDFYIISKLLRKTNCRVVIQKRFGLPFFYAYLKSRILFVSSMVVVLVLLYLSQQFIWRIQYVGNCHITNSTLTEYLEQKNIRSGIFAKSLRLSELEEQLRMDFPEISWASFQRKGTELVIYLKEVPEFLEISDTQRVLQARDIIAPFSGQIQEIYSLHGTPMVHAGDSVVKNQVLISGCVPVVGDDGQIRNQLYVHAAGRIRMSHPYCVKITLPKSYVIKRPLKHRTKGMAIYYNDEERLKLCKKRSKYEFVYKTYYRLGKWTLVWMKNQAYVPETHFYTKIQANDILYKKIEEIMKTFMEKGVQITEKNVKIEETINTWECFAYFLLDNPHMNYQLYDYKDQTQVDIISQ